MTRVLTAETVLSSVELDLSKYLDSDDIQVRAVCEVIRFWVKVQLNKRHRYQKLDKGMSTILVLYINIMMSEHLMSSTTLCLLVFYL